MFEGKIISGIWEDGTIELSGMPKEFILSARTLAVCEVTEHDTLKAKSELFDELRDKIKACCQHFGDAPLKFTLEVTNATKDILSKAKELSK